MLLVLSLLFVILFIVVATSYFKLHPFITLIFAAFFLGFFSPIPLLDVTAHINAGFGNTLKNIGLVILFGTLIGVILEKTGAAITMAETVIKVLGKHFPTLTMSIVGYIVSIPVFCDSGYIILNSLKQSLANRLKVSGVAMSVALATGLFATHNLVPPTPGPIAAASNLKLENLGLVIIFGLIIALCATIAGYLWSRRFMNEEPDGEGAEELQQTTDFETLKASYGKLPTGLQAFAPILVPIVLICLGSVANFPSLPFGEKETLAYKLISFLGQPVNALLLGLFCALTLLKPGKRLSDFNNYITQGILAAAPILLITGAGGAFGEVIQVTQVGTYIGKGLSTLGIGIFVPFIVAAAFKTAQGSSTVALIATSNLMLPILGDLGLDSEMGRVLVVMAIGAGSMAVSHANDSFFWVVTQFSKMSVPQAYRAQTMATLMQGLVAMVVVYILSLILL